MNVYNMVHGTTAATFFILPMLGKHPDEYPRYRDCFLKDEEHPEYNDYIHVYTRVGGANRESYSKEIVEMINHPNYVADFDDSFDSTYASFIFLIPDEWKEDFKKITTMDMKNISELYKKRLYEVFPKLKEKFDEIFKKESS